MAASAFLFLALVSAGGVSAFSDPNWGVYLHDPYYFPTIDCPQHPKALCDFYFDGYENIVPTFHLDDGVVGDHALIPPSRATLNWQGDISWFSPGVRDYISGGFVLANTRNGTFLKYPDGTYDECVAKETFDQFYLNARTDAISRLYARTWQMENPAWHQHGRCFWERKCVFLPFSGAWLAGPSINLNLRDNHTEYDQPRRCVVFKTAQ